MSAIRVENLSKRYVIQHERRHDTLRDRIAGAAHRGWSRLTSRRKQNLTQEEFWALKDVSFEIQPGEVVGVIGRNGAGKSTLLKVLSRITEPTTGRIEIAGRVASLLEVGTGFHPELTGRENIFLNGAILGMSRAEIRRKFDGIVAFAEIERFLDTPVKRYSSGMYVRLAFAVAAHLEPEILIVDEVLAVGDVAFQKKCLGKMQAVSREQGRTVLFVSHNLSSIRQLCRSALLLNAGRIETHGPCNRVLELYQHGLIDAGLDRVPEPTSELRDVAYVETVVVEADTGHRIAATPVGAAWQVRVRLRVKRRLSSAVVGLGIRAADGTNVQSAWIPPRPLEPGIYEAVFRQDQVVLEAGTYTLLVGLTDSDRSLQQFDAARLDVTGESSIGYFPATAGVGAVLNSMRMSLTSAAASAP